MTDKTPQDLANDIYELVNLAVHLAGNNGAKACEIASSAALGAAIHLSLIICKKPRSDEPYYSRQEAAKLCQSIRSELMVFTNLMIANQFHHIKDHDSDHMALVAEFGPHTFGRALAQWQTLYPDLKIEDYVEPPVADVAYHELNKPENRLHAHEIKNSAFVMRNNGSVN